MSRKAAILILLLVLLLPAIVYLPQRPAPEPVYQGRMAMEWALDLQSPTPARREEAAEVLLQFDESVLPSLIRALEMNPTFSQKAYLYHQERIPRRLRYPLLRLLNPHHPVARRQAATRAIPQLPFCAIETVPALSRLLYSGDRFLSYNAAVALLAKGKEPGLQAVIEALESPDYLARVAASSALAGAPAQALPAIPALIHRFQDSAQLAAQAAYTLGQIGSPAIPPLLQALDDTNPRVRQHAVQALALASLHGQARPAMEQLLLKASHESPSIRFEALNALRLIFPVQRKSIQAAIAALGDPELEVRLAALHLLEQAPSAATPGFPALIKILETDPPELAVIALRIIPRIAAEAESAVPVLQRLALHPDPDLQSLAEAALAGMAEK